MDLRIKDKSFLVVGGTSGMGLAAAEALGGEGAAVVVVGRDAARAGRAAEQVADAGAAAAQAVVGDVSAAGEGERVVTDAVEQLDRIGHEPIEIPDDRSVEVFRDVLLGTTRVAESALPHLVATKGAIVTTAAYSIRAPEIARLPYASLKSAVATFTKGIAKAYGPRGVRANCVAPSAIETAALTAIRQQVSDAKGIPYEEALERVMVEDWHLDIALRRPGRPAEVGASSPSCSPTWPATSPARW